MIPNDCEDLLQFGDRLTHGVEIHWFGLGINDSSVWQLRSKVERLRETVASSATAGSTNALATSRLSIADKCLKEWLTKARIVVMLARGSRCSESWIQGSLNSRKTPSRLNDRIDLARVLVTFFARHPEFGVAFAEVTAARGRAIYERVVQSWEILQLAKADFISLKQERDAAARDLRHACRVVIKQTGTRLCLSDPRWADFIRDSDDLNSFQRQIEPAPVRFLSDSNPDAHDVVAA